MSLHNLAQHVQRKGRGQDKMLVHMTPEEVHGLQRLAMAHGGSLTINPETGLPEAGFLMKILPIVAAAAATYFTAGAAAPALEAALAGTAGAGILSWGGHLAMFGDDCFNQSRYFRRDLASLTTSQITINGTNMYKQPLTPPEIYNETILSLYGQNDLSHSVHPGLNSLPAFLTYYFTQILSLNYNKELKEHLISGLDGKGSSFNINWKTTSNNAQIAAGQNQIYPVVFCSKSQIIKINAGRQISIMP
jgi:hypothetical protein